jgi:multimeric flavodoxin WrbA
VAPTPTPLTALALVCSLKRSPAPSSSELIAEHVFDQLRKQEVSCEGLRCVDFAIAPGVQADMGEGDEWPRIREKILAADILVLSTPIWLGHPSSVAQRVLERLQRPCPRQHLLERGGHGAPPTTTTSTRYLRPSPRRPLRLRATPLTWPVHCGRRVIHHTNDMTRRG